MGVGLRQRNLPDAPVLPWIHLLSVIPQGVEQGRSYGLWLRKPVDSVKADTVHKA